MKRRTWFLVLVVLLGAAVALAWPRAEFIPSASPAAWAATPANIARGAYLARAGDCMACHTARGGADYAGGRAIDTPFGRVVAPNITPDAQTGIGAWSADDFWHALHNGIAPGGRLLYPAFPYPNYTRVTRADADALYAYLRSVAPVRQPNLPHALRFPYDRQATLAGWRLLYFRPGVQQEDAARSPDWNRGAYLVEGLGHCGACHSERSHMGATRKALSGGLIPVVGWYAPSLTSDVEAGVGQWDTRHIVQLLRTGVSPEGAVFGPMAEVVRRSLQHLDEADVGAMAVYLKSLPPDGRRPPPAAPPPQDTLKVGKTLYETHCADCHGADGRGAGLAYPPLAGNRALTMAEPVNAIRIVLNGGFPPATAGNPRPYGMPPYSPVLNDAEVAAVVTWVRNSWGNAAGTVTPAQVNRYRAVPLD
ncbi:cytochrome c [uncultured Massilia sp.]|uniref:cytochrome c n=1 Tax=uncultured Massilia sp. TaxID=169973 RepID=UPI0025D36DA4|nr:cytochrome c [uncultured Massilia sp.]